MSLTSLPLVGGQVNVTYLISDAGVDDNDLGKAVKMSTTTDTVTLAVAGDEIYGFINSIEPGTEGGKVVVTVCISGRVRVTTGGLITIGALVEGAAQTAAGTAKTGNWAAVTTHAVAVIGDVFPKNWRLISDDGTDGTVESC